MGVNIDFKKWFENEGKNHKDIIIKTSEYGYKEFDRAIRQHVKKLINEQ